MSDQDEIILLRARADKLSIKYHPNTGAKKLKAKIEAELAPDVEEAPTALLHPSEPKRKSINQIKTEKRKYARQLVRIKLSCMNPNKKEYEGEYHTISNSVFGSITRYVPYNAEDGWHIERALFNLLKEKRCQIFKTKKDAKGRKVRKGELIKEFAIEVLAPLTHPEIKKLAQLQAITQANAD
jgi:hypothetical protein